MNSERLSILAREAKLELNRREVTDSTLSFTRYFYRKQERKNYIVNDHHRIIAEALDAVVEGKIKRLIINMPPRYGKTQLAVKSFMAKGLARNPKAKFIHLSYSDDLALDNSEAVRTLVQEDSFTELFPDVRIKRDSKAKKKWYTVQGGGIYATGAGGQVTGFGAGKVDPDQQSADYDGQDLWFEEEDLPEEVEGFGGAIVIDDPIKPEDADSETVRSRVNNRFDSTIRNRTNSRNTPIIIIMHRLHQQDLCGYLLKLEPEMWTVISLPAIQKDGTALWPHKHTLAELEHEKKINPVVFERQYMQNPKPAEGLLFPEGDLHYFKPSDLPNESVEFIYLSVDPADTGGDDTAAPLGELYSGGIFITETIFNKLGTDVNIPALVELIISREVDHTEIEGNSAWRLFANQVKGEVHDRDPDRSIRTIKAFQNKHVRITAQSAFIRHNMYFLSEQYWTPQYRAFMENLTSYMADGSSKHEDAPDALAMMAVYFRKTFPELWKYRKGQKKEEEE